MSTNAMSSTVLPVVQRAGVLDRERIRAVATRCCPHTAISDDIAAARQRGDSRHAAKLARVLVEFRRRQGGCDEGGNPARH